MSARYTPLPNVNYVPDAERIIGNSNSTNKQASRLSGVQQADSAAAEYFISDIQRLYADIEERYQLALTNGVPKELARIILPVGRYSRMRASANLRNWLGFLTLRLDEGAQWEIRQYADAVAKLLRTKFPRTMELFDAE